MCQFENELLELPFFANGFQKKQQKNHMKHTAKRRKISNFAPSKNSLEQKENYNPINIIIN